MSLGLVLASINELHTNPPQNQYESIMVPSPT
jgi:hypothetical protein